ncbi:MAG: M48 family metalloprotease [Candidatus Competibacteraceae bacterium]|nr:M48 family metalloprotease [Candidatus Competibacteraceae bacterium]
MSCLVILLSLASSVVSAQSLALPDFGDPSRQYLSSQDERRLGLSVVRRLRDRGLLLEDVQLNEYLNSLGQRIAAHANYDGTPFTFFWINDSAINAFATPGGFIGVNAGLFLATRNEDELAGVVAHEIAHVAQRHIARAFAATQRLALPVAAAMIASAILAASTDSDVGRAALAGTAAASTQRQINFTRANEQEADRVGTQLLARAGFDPNGVAGFFGRLQQLSGSSANQVPEYLLTHPFPSSRAADTQDRQAPIRSRSSPRDSKAYYLAKTRLNVLTNTQTSELVRRFETVLNNGDYKREAAERYGYALALKRAGRYSEAQREINRLRKSDPNNLAFRIEEAELALAQGDRAQAWRLFEDTRALYPDDFTVAMHYGRALATQGDPHQAQQILEPHLRRQGNNASLHALYAQAAQRTGDTATTHATLAEYHYLNGELTQAIEQVELGLRDVTATPYQLARLRAQLKQFREEQNTQGSLP